MTRTLGLRELPRAVGVSRMFDNDKAILVSFVRPLTDDELRRLHAQLSELTDEGRDWEVA